MSKPPTASHRPITSECHGEEPAWKLAEPRKSPSPDVRPQLRAPTNLQLRHARRISIASLHRSSNPFKFMGGVGALADKCEFNRERHVPKHTPMLRIFTLLDRKSGTVAAESGIINLANPRKRHPVLSKPHRFCLAHENACS